MLAHHSLNLKRQKLLKRPNALALEVLHVQQVVGAKASAIGEAVPALYQRQLCDDLAVVRQQVEDQVSDGIAVFGASPIPTIRGVSRNTIYSGGEPS